MKSGPFLALLLLQAFRVNAGEGFDECAFAVIDVTGGSKNEMLFGHEAVETVRIASTTRSSWCEKIVRRSSLNRRSLI